MRGVLATLVTLVLVGLSPAPASAWMFFAADATQQPGQIAFLLAGSGTFTGVDIAERVDGADVPLRTVVPVPQGEFFGDSYPRSAQWRCDRLTRVFTARGRRPDGAVETATFTLRTPSCRNRLTLTAPRTARPGARVTLTLRDRFKLGDVDARLCVRPPGAREDCARLRIAEGRSVAASSFRARRTGVWRASLKSPSQSLRAAVGVGVAPPAGAPALPVVLATGDSLMQGSDAVLGDRLTHRAEVRSDVRIGAKISRDEPVDWAKLPATHLKRFRPAATVIFLGNAEGYPMKTPAGAQVACCDEPWIAEYARRARGVFRTYLREGAVVWLNVPIAKDPQRKPINEAVNAAVARAAQGLDRAAVVDAAAIFTPGGVYRDVMTDRGRSVRVRESDGVHLSPDGAAIAVRAVLEQLERLGVV